jgi:ribonuclease BN (tRNA processing enzyme)
VRLRVLGSAGAEFPSFNPPGYLVDGKLLLDAGTVCTQLTQPEQQAVETILVTHSHLDHIREIPVLADNLITLGTGKSIVVAATAATLAALRNHLMNGILWPDFTALPSGERPVVRYRELEPETEVELEGYLVTPIPVNHPVPAVGYLLRKDSHAWIYTGDTGPTEAIWRRGCTVDALMVEVSFPNSLRELALASGHLTPHLLAAELAKMARLPRRVLVTHLKPQFIDQIVRELAELDIPGIELLKGGATYEL